MEREQRAEPKALALCGSPRRHGNTAIYLEAVLDALKEHGVQAQLVSLADTPILNCRACYACWESDSRVCQVQGDGFHEIYDEMLSADALLVGSPVHYGFVHPAVWSVLVRAGFPGMKGHPDSAPRPFVRKIGAPITVARRAGQNTAFAQLLLWFFINEFIVPGSIYWGVGVARAPGDARTDAEGERTARRIGENIAWLLQKVRT